MEKQTADIKHLLSGIMAAGILSACSALDVENQSQSFLLSQPATALSRAEQQEVIANVVALAADTIQSDHTTNCLQRKHHSGVLAAESCYFVSPDGQQLFHQSMVHKQLFGLRDWFEQIDKMKLDHLILHRLTRSGEIARLKSDKPVVFFVFDTSGSMDQTENGEAKITTARKSIIDTINKIDTKRFNTSLITFDQNRHCAASLAVPPNNNDPDRIIDQVRRIKPAGPTPLAEAMALAGDALARTEKKMVILFSDGVESCGGDPVREAQRLNQKYGIKVNLQIIGYGVNGTATEDLKKLADINPEWAYYAAHDAESLDQAINKITQQGALLDPLWTDLSTSTFQFDSGSTALEATYTENIQKIYRFMRHNDKKIEIIGHTDSIGDENSNLILSLQRAKMVKSKLVELGISESRILVSGKGEAEPVSSNETEAGRFQNRRVVIRVL